MKAVLLQDRTLVESYLQDTGVRPLEQADAVLSGLRFDRLVATGYGRHLAREYLNCAVVTEIKAHAAGALSLFPYCQTVVDVGGQDSKVIRIKSGVVEDFEMNDRCAAGTGRFLEVMARALNCEVAAFGGYALGATEPAPINSMCTVFAESEVVSLIAKGEDPRRIALGLHHAILNRLAALLNRLGAEGEIVLTGGVAKNPCFRALLIRRYPAVAIRLPEEPQIVGALGAALLAEEQQ